MKGEIFRNLADAEGSGQPLDRAGQASPFDRFDWFDRTWALANPGGEPLIARARAEGSDAWLFLTEAGGKASALSSWYTLKFGPIFSGDPADTTKSALLVAIARRLRKRRSPPSSITLAPVPDEDAALVARAFSRAGWIAASSETTVNWTIDVSGKVFAEYWAERPGELRSTVKRKGAKSGIACTVYNSLNDDIWNTYESVYDNSWKPEEGSADFLRDMAQSEGAAGTLRIGIGTIEGEPVAAQIWTVEHGRAIIHKLAYLESAAAHSPGSALTAAMFEHVIDTDHVEIVDFGTGDDRYKADWMDRRDPLYTVKLFNPHTLPGLAGAAKARLSALVRPLRTR